ncbi:DUF992 domain-containing protein [Hyphomicrobium sp. D-2]|uniref:DUF992 domain-containing protein n=1 Tax=Hyphomicrobium sp. D-2 TaxID=3041621 RepID=UPI0024543ACA|nr:DUF992 domain-containing protein [Hyphomicrobium sp. D-2]MDH4980884.1 DUF992 domain-containing protein [Hyphomicrobium sp. D-2]
MRWPIAAVITPFMFASVAHGAAPLADVGVLTCTLAEQGQRETNPDSETRAIYCSFKPSSSGPEETYAGEIKNVGSTDSLDKKRVLIWAVLGPGDRELKPGVLAQSFMGESAGEAIEGGQNPTQLTGDEDDAYRLRPINEDKEQAAEATGALTVVELRIKSVPS